MKLLKPNSRDISDIGLAIKSFNGAWGSIDFFGNYEPMMNGKTLWLMFNFEITDVNMLYEETAPAKFVEMFESDFKDERGILHAQASKIKIWFVGYAWLLNVTYMIDGKSFPLGFLGASDQTSLWRGLHDTLDFKDRFLVNAETALSPF